MFVSRTDELTRHRILARPMRMGFTARRYAGAVYAVVVCPSVCPSVRLSQTSIVSKQMDESSWFLAWRLPHCLERKFGYVQN